MQTGPLAVVAACRGDDDPCTGLPQLVTINVTLYEHQGHNNNFFGRAEKTGFTSSDYVLVGGHDQFHANNNVLTGSFKDVWRDPVDEAGDRPDTQPG